MFTLYSVELQEACKKICISGLTVNLEFLLVQLVNLFTKIRMQQSLKVIVHKNISLT